MPPVEVSDNRIVCQQWRFNEVKGGVIFGLAGLLAAPVGALAGLPWLVVLFLLVVAAFGMLLLLLSPYARIQTVDKRCQTLTLERRRVLGHRVREVRFGDIIEVVVERKKQIDDPDDAYVVFISRSTGEKIAVGARDCTDKDKQEELARVLRSFLGKEK
jgi:hypothetical protein